MPQMSNIPWISLFLFLNLILNVIESNNHFSKKKKW